MVRVGVTGATGFIGGAVVPRLGAAGYDLRLVDNRSGPVCVEYDAWPVPKLDFGSDEALRLLSDSDVLLHLGAISGVMACARDPAGTARVNVDATQRLYGMCQERKIPVAFASSFAVVGAPEHLPVREDTPARPTHEYARQKALGERLTREVAESGAAPAAILRQSNVYGGYWASGRRVSKGNVLEQFARQAADGRLTVNSPGTQRRDFVHIDDVVAFWEATVRFLLRSQPPPVFHVFNVASGESFSVLQVAEGVARAYAALTRESPPLRIDLVPNPREGVELVEPAFSVDPTASEVVLGVRPRHHLVEELPGILRPVSPGGS